ncbi:hypothetical protein BDV24DRAFT_143742 [Aspergillus arachidicola]|uniref:Uncharacterized protein n=1 Tax=Aspergillus arachidicola TaxID=656916 RepID=A0A5N6XQP9_9EURO|nr:hypothetical protein BDV24DRAFT_143742 [Aspergillus arachidicola]
MTKDGGDESPNHVGEWLLEVLPGGRQSFRIIGMEKWATTPYLLTSHSVFLINPTTLDVCSRIGSDMLTTILPRDKEILDNGRDIESWLAMTHCPSAYLIRMDVHTSNARLSFW